MHKDSVILYQLSGPTGYNIYIHSPEVEIHSFHTKIVPNAFILQKNKRNMSIFLVYKSVLLIYFLTNDNTTLNDQKTTNEKEAISLTRPEGVVVFAQ